MMIKLHRSQFLPTRADCFFLPVSDEAGIQIGSSVTWVPVNSHANEPKMLW
jgi:hypothetical protein